MQIQNVDKRRMVGTIEICDEEGEERQIEIPIVFEVCPRCEGTGRHTHPGVDGHGITEEERECDWSPDEWEDYLHGGYDVDCLDCGGDHVVAKVNLDVCTEEQRKFVSDREELEAEEKADWDSERWLRQAEGWG